VRRHIRTLAAALVVGVTLIVGVAPMAAAVSAPTAVPSARAPMLVLGDSLCVGARDHGGQMSAQLRAARWEPTYACEIGRGITWGTDQVRKMASVPRTVVVALGTNGGEGEWNVDAKLGALRSALFARGARQLVWVDYANRAGGYEDKNRVLSSFAARQGDLVVRWSEQAAAHPQWFSSDGLHYTADGQRAWAAAIVATAQQAHGRSDDTAVDIAVRGGATWVLMASGEVYIDGSAEHHGDVSGMALNGAPRAIVATSTGNGYWIMGADGGVFSFGGAAFHGSTGSMRLNAPVVSMAASPDGGGYWLLAGDGGVFSFGNARFHGSTGSMRLNAPVVAMAVDPTGGGYWLLARDGGVFTFGTSAFHGSTGSLRLGAPMMGMAVTPAGGGYWLGGSDGGVFAFGDAPFRGSAVGSGTTATAIESVDGGYVQLLADGRILRRY
jgi:hypothetical protein